MGKLEDINKILRENGKPELTELPKPKEEKTEGKTTAEIEAENLAAAELAKKTEAEKNKTPERKIDADAVLAFLNEQGIVATSLEDLKRPAAPEDKEKIAERKEAEKLSWGLASGKFTRKEYETLVKDSADLEKLAFSDYHAKAKAEDPNLSDADIQAEFADLYGINEDVKSRRYKNGQHNLQVVASDLLAKKHQKILSLDSEYSAYEQSQNYTKEKQQKILLGAPAYKTAVQTAMTRIKKITAKFDDTESYEAQVADELIAKVEGEFLNPEYAAKMIDKGYTVEQIEEIGFTRVLREAFPIISKEVAVQYHKNKVAGTKGLPPAGFKDKRPKTALTEDQQKMVDEYEKNKREVEAPIAN
jgi:hypothetical protein